MSRRFAIQWTRPLVITLASCALVTIVFAALAWHRRWISDDGLIVVRTVRNILAGNGPNFNAFERAEANTSTLWQWIIVAVVGIFRGDAVFTTVVIGWVLSVAAAVIGLDATRRWHRERGSTEAIVPAGALVLIGVVPFWDFATSGLETSLSLLWLATCWWLLVALRPERRLRFHLAAVVTFGLGPLVRPDFAVAAAVFLVATWVILRPKWTRVLGFGAAAIALPFAYEIFRAGYYGTLVPLPAIAKSATHSEWARGFHYLVDFARPCVVWMPAIVLIVLGGVVVRTRAIGRRDQIVIGAMLVAAALMTLFVLRVGGDFMHARMLLPPTFVAVLPVFVLPVRRLTLPFINVLVVWAVIVALWRGGGKPMATEFRVADERAGYVRWTQTANPVTDAPFIAAEGAPAAAVKDALAKHEHRLLSEGGVVDFANPAYPQPVIYVAGRLGTGGVATPLEGIVVDALGLANPLGARITVNQPGMTGHEKSLPWTWIRADYADPATDIQHGELLVGTRAARHAMTCGELKELLDSVRAPMTASRFWSNLTGAVRRTRLEIPVDPIEAELKFCGPVDLTARITASTSYENEGWSVGNLVDGVRESRPPITRGWTSEVGDTQWLQFEWLAPITVSKLVLYPSGDPNVGDGFPIDFHIDTWNGTAWVEGVRREAFPGPVTTPQTFALPAAVTTSRIRITATKLPPGNGGPRFQLAEVELQ